MDTKEIENLLAAAQRVVDQSAGQYKEGCACASCRLADALKKVNEIKTLGC